MLAHTKTHRTERNNVIFVTYKNTKYAIPEKIASKFIVKEKPNTKEDNVQPEDAFKHLIDKFTKAGTLLKGLRAREGLSQLEFAKKLNITQPNLSSMENGKRPIGKDIAKRIEKIFGTDYRYFLE